MDPEVQKIIEELQKITNSSDLVKYQKTLEATIKGHSRLNTLGKAEQKEVKTAIDQRKRLFQVSSNLEGHFKKFGQTAGLSEKASASFAKGTAKTTSFLGKLGTAINEGTGHIEDYTKSLAEFGVVGETLARAGGFLGSVTNQFRTLSSVGATFGQNLVELREVSASAGIPIADFVDLIGKNSEALALLYGSTTQGARAFSNLSADFRRANIDFLAPLGLTVEEINEFLIGNLTLQRRTGMIQGRSQAEQLQYARTYIEQLDRLARLTGQQRSTLQSNVEAQLANERFLAMLNQQTPEVAAKLQAFTAGVSSIAPELATGLQDLIATAGNPVTDAAIEFAQNIPEAQAIVKELLAGQITEQEAMVKMRDAAGKSNQRFNEVTATGTVEFLRLQGGVNKLANATLDVTAAENEQSAAAQKLTAGLTGFENSMKNLTSASDSLKTQFLGLFSETGLLGKLNTGIDNLATGIKNMSTENQALLFALKESAVVIGGVLKDTVPLYGAVRLGVQHGMAGAGFGGAGGKAKGIGGKLMKGGAAVAGMYGTKMGMDMAGAEGASTGDKIMGIGTGAASGALTGAMVGSMVPIIGTAIGAALGGAVGGGMAAYEGYSEEIKGFFGNLFGGSNNQRAFGTMGTTGSFTEPTNTLAMLHAGEKVLSPSEAKTYADTMSKSASVNAINSTSTTNNMSSEFGNLLNELKGVNKNLNTLVAINDATKNSSERMKIILANRTESLV